MNTIGTPTMTPAEEAAWVAAMRAGVRVTDVGPSPTAQPKATPKPKPPAVPTPAQEACVHRWRLDTPNGQTVGAVCRLCGAEREYQTTCDVTAADLLRGHMENHRAKRSA